MADIETNLKASAWVSGLKKNAPGLYRFAFYAYFRLKALLDMPRYLFCRWTHAPYFGPVMLGAQTWETRDPHMRTVLAGALAQTKSDEPFRVLEIGSWAGQSSILWASEIVRAGRTGQVFCVDPWMPFMKETHLGSNAAVSIMDRAARRDKIFPLFWHNVKSAGLTDVILPLRGRSQDILPALAPESLDLVFVDGSHSFTDFMTDLTLAGPLVRDAGIICGDDLEMQIDEVDPETAEANCEKDYVTDPKTGRDYHPGVCVGISRYFKQRVSSRDGFWAVRKSGDGWEPIQFK